MDLPQVLRDDEGPSFDCAGLGTHQAVFRWVLKRLAAEGLLSGKNLGVDATTLEANAALKSIVRRDDGASYDEHVTELMKTEGLEHAQPERRTKVDESRSTSRDCKRDRRRRFWWT